MYYWVFITLSTHACEQWFLQAEHNIASGLEISLLAGTYTVKGLSVQSRSLIKVPTNLSRDYAPRPAYDLTVKA